MPPWLLATEAEPPRLPESSPPCPATELHALGGRAPDPVLATLGGRAPAFALMCEKTGATKRASEPAAESRGEAAIVVVGAHRHAPDYSFGSTRAQQQRRWPNSCAGGRFEHPGHGPNDKSPARAHTLPAWQQLGHTSEVGAGAVRPRMRLPSLRGRRAEQSWQRRAIASPGSSCGALCVPSARHSAPHTAIRCRLAPPPDAQSAAALVRRRLPLRTAGSPWQRRPQARRSCAPCWTAPRP